MPNVVIYIGAEDARRIEAQGHDLKAHIKEIVRRALEIEAESQPPQPPAEHFKPDPK